MNQQVKYIGMGSATKLAGVSRTWLALLSRGDDSMGATVIAGRIVFAEDKFNNWLPKFKSRTKKASDRGLIRQAMEQTK